MRILIAVPSKNRSDILCRYAWQWLIYTGIDYRVFIEPQDKEKYRFVHNVVVMEEDNKGLGYAKHFIKSYAIEHGYGLIFKVDDDVRGFTDYRNRLDPEDTGYFLKKVIPEIVSAFKEREDIKAIGFPYSFEMFEKKKWSVVKRLQTSYIVRTEDLYTDPAISVFEDFATALHIIANGGIVMRYGMAGIDMGIPVGGGTGGHQSFNRYEQALREANVLRQIYPPLNFRKVQKPWKIEPDMSSVVQSRKR